jgi:Raf kinase inhibitor-like YbhB/YbcL family protein
MTISLSSPDFSDGQTIPRRFTCDGEDRSPELTWHGVPADTMELALLMEDPDAPGGTFVHWVLWGLDPMTASLSWGEMPGGAHQGRNDFGRTGYGGPCPPRGRPHRYVFTLLALAQPLSLKPGATAAALRREARGKVLAEGTLTGRYVR